MRILHEAFAVIGELLLFLAGVAQLPVLAVKYRSGEVGRTFKFIELVVNALT
ncbi:hypothetical protein SAMN00120144_1056 [Hymenobacter roseosalivarius DSM 11622]|uniref:Uncharacterized protein n=1 Tax=Hymenobacter roseosalivarius DSM 11622 TaxID=645990 RepID=A0A1W1VY71_9BACT|nr:hypothetical protein SAMN00120144_1056 [Hymenobacter roseosalivarius DSM 11622]